jgi:chromosomal replication initiation ATPase DnaA
MTEKKELEVFFRNMQQGLKRFTLKELNESLHTLVNNKEDKQKDKQKQIILVLDAVCKDYGITKDYLIKGKAKGDLQQARNIAYCILHLDLGLSIRYIAKNVFYLEWHNSVGVAIKYHKELNTDIAPDKKFKEKLEKIKSGIVAKIKNDKL